MVAINNCLTDAVEKKQITGADAQRVAALYNAYRRKAAAQGGEATADAEAKAALQAALKAETDHEKRKAKLSLSSIRRIAQDLDGFRTASGKKDIGAAALAMLEHDGTAKFQSVAAREKAVIGKAHAMMENLLYHFRRGAVLGDKGRWNAAQLPNVVRALFGEEVDDVAAQGLAESWTKTAEMLRERFNKAGGAIGKLENWGMPQHHDPKALLNVGRDAWVAAIKPMLDASRMRHPLTGLEVLPEELDHILGEIWRGIATGGWDKREPLRQAFGKGALANQHAEHRFLVFKDADTWLAYQRDYGGGGDPFAAMMSHVSVMSRDIAAMEVLGPNPSGTIEWLKQAVSKEGNLAQAGEPSRFAGNPKTAANRAEKINHEIDNVWGSLRGSLSPVGSRLAAVAGGVRTFITSSVLGGAALSSVTDVASQAVTRHFALGAGGSPIGIVKDIVYALTPEGRREAVSAGLILDSAMHAMQQQARYVGTLGGPQWLGYVADRVLTYSGLTPWTQGGKHAFGLAFMHEVANSRGQAWDKIHPNFRDTFQRFGITEKNWETINLAKSYDTPSGLTLVRPNELSIHDAALAERYVGMIQTLTAFAVPEGGHRSRVALLGNTRPGTWVGEFVRSVAQFKSFGAVFVMMHGGEVARRLNRNGAGNAAAYASSLLIGSTMLGALAMQLKAVAAGRDPQNMNDDRFWAGALLQGGGLGIFGDFFFSDINRYGGGIAGALAGPLLERGSDFQNLTIGNAIELAQGKDPKFGAELVKFARGNIPGGNIWQIRLAWERLVLDQMQFLLDPEANASFKRRQQTFAREYGQEFWWQPGQVAPTRAPNFVGGPSGAIGSF